MLKIGVSIISMKAAEFVAATVLAEELGYESVWYGEHILLPRGTIYPVNPQPYGPQELLDPFVLLAGLAGRTSRIRLATGILQLPLRNPVMAARQALSVDIVSNGRFDLAVGLGWLQDEFDAAATDMRTRGARTDEMLDLMNRLFQPGDVAFEGKFYRLPLSPFDPKPIQKPRPPFLIGGGSEAALRRAARWDGWYGVAFSPEQFKTFRAKIEGYRREYSREKEPFQYVLVLYQGGPGDGGASRAQLEDFVAAGVDRIVVTPWGFDHDHALARIAEFANEIGLAA